MVLNNRETLKTNIAGLHQLAATLTKQPVLLLSDDEATQLTERTADVLDHLGWNITGEGESPFIVKVLMLGATVFVIYKPKIDQIAAEQAAINVTPSRPSTPGEARANGGRRPDMVDFSADIDTAAEINRGTEH